MPRLSAVGISGLGPGRMSISQQLLLGFGGYFQSRGGSELSRRPYPVNSFSTTCGAAKARLGS